MRTRHTCHLCCAAQGSPDVFWQEGFGFRNIGEAVHVFCGVGRQP